MTEIYKYTNTITNQVYIGKTKDASKRCCQSLYLQSCPKFADAIKKYGWDAFIRETLEWVEDDIASKKELEYIALYDSYSTGYNTKPPGNIQKRTPVGQYTLDGQLVAEFLSISSAEKATGIYNISRVCNGERKTAGGYKWKFIITGE